MTISRFRLGAGSFAVGSLMVLAGRLLARRKGQPALPAPSSYGQVGAVPLASEATGVSHPAGAEHVPTDLQGDCHPGFDDRAVPAFRPDMDAPMSAEEREALRPAPPLQSAADAVAQSERAEAF